MDQAKSRFLALPLYIQNENDSRYKLRETYEALSEDAKKVAEFNKKLDAAEKRAREAEPFVAQIAANRKTIQDIVAHPDYAGEKMRPAFVKSFKAVTTKQGEFEWSADGTTLVRGKPSAAAAKATTPEQVIKLWNEYLAAKPKPVPVEFPETTLHVADFESYAIRVANRFKDPIEYIKSKKDLAEKLEQIYTTIKELARQANNSDEDVDVSRVSAWANELAEACAKQKPVAKPEVSASCTGKKCTRKATNGPHCRKCSVDYYNDEIAKEIRIRQNEYRRRVSKQEFQKYEAGARNAYEEAHVYFEDKDGEKGYEKLFKAYKALDKVLPKMGTFKVKALEGDHIVSSSDDDEEKEYDADEEEEDEEEEEEEEEESSSSEPRRKQASKKRERVSARDVLSIVPQTDPKLYNLQEISDSSEFEDAFKRLKRERTKEYRIFVKHKITGEIPKYWPWFEKAGDTVQKSRAEAEAKAVELVEICGGAETWGIEIKEN